MIADSRRLVAGVLDGDPRAIARSISLVEAEGAAGADIIKGVFQQSGRATLLGVTGAPGVGKSSLVDRLVTTVHTVEIAEHNDTIAEFVGHFVIVSDDLHVQFP